MKHKLTALMLALTASAAISAGVYAADYPYGDADADKTLTASDAAAVLQKVLNENTSLPIEASVSNFMTIVDVDADSSLTAADAAVIMQKVLNEGFVMPIENTADDTQATYDTNITLADGASSADNKGVIIDNENNIITITNGGVYTITGTLSNGQIVVDSEKDVELALCGVSVTNSSGPAVYGLNGDIDISAKKQTVNTLTDGTPAQFETETAEDGTVTVTDEPDACIFSHDGIKLKGTGVLVVNGNYKNGITGKDEVVIQKLDLTVNSLNNCIKGKDYVTVKSGTLNLTSQTGDGIRVTSGDLTVEDGSITISAQDNGLFTKAGNIVIAGGTLDITVVPGGTADTESYNYDGIHTKAGTIDITGGNITVKSYCDGIQGTSDVNISGAAVIDVTTTGIISSSSSGGYGGWSNNQTADISAKGIKSDTVLNIDGGAKITVNSTDDSLHTNGTITLTAADITVSAGDDGVHADSVLTINDGCTLRVDKSYEGIEAEKIYINGGSMTIYASDDNINAAGGSDGSSQGGFNQNADGYIEINGGYIYCENANAGGDGVDSNGKIVQNGGVLLVNGPTSGGDASIDTGDKSGDEYIINGGTVFSVGSNGMAESPSSSGNAYAVTYGINGGGMGGPGQGGGRPGQPGGFDPGTQSGGFDPGTQSGSIGAGTQLTLADESGNVIATFTVKTTAQAIVISTPNIAAGNTYTLYSGGEYSGSLDENGYAEGGTITGGTRIASCTVNSKITAMS